MVSPHIWWMCLFLKVCTWDLGLQCWGFIHIYIYKKQGLIMSKQTLQYRRCMLDSISDHSIASDAEVLSCLETWFRIDFTVCSTSARIWMIIFNTCNTWSRFFFQKQSNFGWTRKPLWNKSLQTWVHKLPRHVSVRLNNLCFSSHEAPFFEKLCTSGTSVGRTWSGISEVAWEAKNRRQFQRD